LDFIFPIKFFSISISFMTTLHGTFSIPFSFFHNVL
jgi:hypothetical protein